MNAQSPAEKFGHRYPWSDWFASRRFTIRPNVDYDPRVCRPYTMAQIARNRASSDTYRLKLNIRIHEDGTIDVEVVGNLPPRPTRRTRHARRS